MHGNPEVSIIIPVLDQRRQLLQCLRALEAQTFPRTHFEVIVIDNRPDSSLAALVDDFAFVRGLREPKPGSYAARNCGIRASRGRVLGFTDADCRPAPDWIERGVHALGTLPEVGMVGGRIDLTFVDPGHLTPAELYESIFAFHQEVYIRSGFAATANLFTTRSTMDEVGYFDERLMSGGDMEWGQRVRSRGFIQIYADDVRVFHPARTTVADLMRKVRRVAAGNQQLDDLHGRGLSDVSGYAWDQLVKLRRIRSNISDKRLAGFGRKVRFASLVWLVDVLRTVERYRIHYGGRVRRT